MRECCGRGRGGVGEWGSGGVGEMIVSFEFGCVTNRVDGFGQKCVALYSFDLGSMSFQKSFVGRMPSSQDGPPQEYGWSRTSQEHHDLYPEVRPR